MIGLGKVRILIFYLASVFIAVYYWMESTQYIGVLQEGNTYCDWDVSSVYDKTVSWPPESDIIAYSVASILVRSYKANLQFNTCYSSAIPMSVSSVLPKMCY